MANERRSKWEKERAKEDATLYLLMNSTLARLRLAKLDAAIRTGTPREVTNVPDSAPETERAVSA